MGEQDSTEKVLEDYNDVFADIVNGLLFYGKEIIHEDQLVNTKDKSQYKADDTKLHEQERDIAKFWKKRKIRIALCGIENQTDIDIDMPLRVMGYDGAAYRSQLLADNKERYPVITIVLHFGMKRWRRPHSLLECFRVPKYLKPYVNDYKIHVFDIAYLTDEQVNYFKSDFKIVADYFVQKRKNKDYKPSKDTIKHVDALLKLMSVLTKDDRYIKAQENGKGSVRNMCEALDKVEARGRAAGEAIGRAAGEAIGRAAGELKGKIEAYADMNLSIPEIAKKVNVSEEEVQRILENL
ncbi:MAG: Rpn family recombination-promoting nuclease/putative transposase [Lachnospiraceae bacterium]|nr:Rpn family recombination-promoting nuclease/putative transposase [Lachnospiraceae bacterium]